MDRELLVEIGTEEMPASWLPGITLQLGDVLRSRLNEVRLSIDEPIETYSTPRRLTARAGKVGERQTDLEELVTGPPVSAAYGPNGQLTPAGLGFAKKQGVEPDALERVETAKGVYVGLRRHQRGRAAVDVMPEVLTGLLRGLSFPKQMRWDALLEDGRGELPFGRPIRWLLFLYGGRVVPFAIHRSPAANSSLVQSIHTAAMTYGHRFLTTSGRAGRAIKVKHFDDYRKRLAENFVVLERSERRDRIVRELGAESNRRGGRVASALIGNSMLDEVPDLVEYPFVVSGTFADEFLSLPEEVLATTMIHHQHFFPLSDPQGKLMPVFLAVLNMEPEKADVIVRNLERVLAARLRDARFFLDADREQTLEQHVQRLSTVLFHKKLGSYLDKTKRIEELAKQIATYLLNRVDQAEHAGAAGRLCKADLATDMVRELTELQGTIGGVYAREQGWREEVWKAIYFHYLPVAVEATAPPTKEQLGVAAVTWAAVSLADKLDTLVGMFAAGERPTGSRDPYGIRRAAQGIVRILIDLPELTGLNLRLSLGQVLETALGISADGGEVDDEVLMFLTDRVRYVLEQRGHDARNVRSVTHEPPAEIVPLVARRKIETLPEFTESPEFRQLAVLFKRVKNIAKNLDDSKVGDLATLSQQLRATLKEPAELALLDEVDRLRPVIEETSASGRGYREAFAECAKAGPTVARFFDDVMVMTEDPKLREARLRLLKGLERLILQLADVSEIVPEEK
jgi:glycyl-tRNA synthetase beta chain